MKLLSIIDGTAAVDVDSSGWFAFRDQEPPHRQKCEVELFDGTRYEAVWMSMCGVGGYALNVSGSKVANYPAPVARWRPLSNSFA